MSSQDNPDQAMVGAGESLSRPSSNPNETMQLLQHLAGYLREHLPRTEETAAQVTTLATRQTAVDSSLSELQNRTDTLQGAVNTLDTRTVQISGAIDNLAAATSLSHDQIRDLARTLNQVQINTSTSLGTLVTQLRTELNPVLDALRVPPAVTNESGSVDTPSTSTATPTAPPALASPQTVPEGRSSAEHAFHLRTRIGDCPRYNGDRTNDAAVFWTAEAWLWLQKYETLTRTVIPQDQAIALLSDSLEEKASRWWIQLEKEALLLKNPALLPKTVDGFFNALRTEFQELNAEDKRRQRYEKVTQTGSVQGYITAFKDRLMYLHPRPTNYEALRQFKKGLDENIKFEMATRHSAVDNLEEYWTHADAIDRAFKEAGVNLTSSRSKPKPPTTPSPGSSPSPGRVHYVSSLMPSKKRDPKLFKNWCRENKACYECGSSSHKSSECPKKKSTSNGSSKSEN